MKHIKKIIRSYSLKVVLLCTFSVLLFSYGNAQKLKGGGGGKKPANSVKTKKISKPSVIGGGDKKPQKGGDRNNVSNSANRNIKAGNKTNVGNKVKVDNSKRNVNINVDKSKDVRIHNSRNTVVRRSSRPYVRPAYVYGGRRFRCYRPYVFHPYRPYVWGPRWHPWGFFVTTLAVTAIIISVDNDVSVAPVLDNSFYSFEEQTILPVASFASYNENPSYSQSPVAKTVSFKKEEFYYDEGVYYIKSDGGYIVVSAPIGATIKSLPTGYETVSVDDKTKNYYYGGTFYEKTNAGYTVVTPIAGTIVTNVSKGGEEIKMGDITYVKLGETYYQPIKEDGKDMYEVADVEDDK